MYGPYQTLCNRCRCWPDKGVLGLILTELAQFDGRGTEVLIIDATHLKAHRRAASRNKGAMHLA